MAVFFSFYSFPNERVVTVVPPILFYDYMLGVGWKHRYSSLFSSYVSRPMKSTFIPDLSRDPGLLDLMR